MQFRPQEYYSYRYDCYISIEAQTYECCLLDTTDRHYSCRFEIYFRGNCTTWVCAVRRIQTKWNWNDGQWIAENRKEIFAEWSIECTGNPVASNEEFSIRIFSENKCWFRTVIFIFSPFTIANHKRKSEYQIQREKKETEFFIRTQSLFDHILLSFYSSFSYTNFERYFLPWSIWINVKSLDVFLNNKIKYFLTMQCHLFVVWIYNGIG